MSDPLKIFGIYTSFYCTWLCRVILAYVEKGQLENTSNVYGIINARCNDNERQTLHDRYNIWNAVH